MKKYKKGFIIMVILLVVVIVLAVFGIAYYMGKSSNSSVSNLPKVGENLSQENQIVNNNPSDCSPTTAPWIKVVYPNGGEVYEMGQKVDIKWKTCNAQTGQTVSLNIGTEVPASKNNGISGAFNQVVSFYPLKITNDGIENVTLSGYSTNGNWPFISGENYKISVVLNPLPTNTQETPFVQDMSDNFFTINPKNTSKDLRKNGETCGDGIGNCQTGLKCGYPCGIPGCQNVCMPENELPKP